MVRRAEQLGGGVPQLRHGPKVHPAVEDFRAAVPRFLRHRDWPGRGLGPAGAISLFSIIGTPLEAFLFGGERGGGTHDVEACRSQLAVGLSVPINDK